LGAQADDDPTMSAAPPSRRRQHRLTAAWTRSREKLLLLWADVATSRPRLVLLASLALALACSVLAATQLRYDPDRSSLVDPTLPWQKRYAQYKRNYPHWDDAVVVVDAGVEPSDESRRLAGKLLDALAQQLAQRRPPLVLTTGFATSEAPPGLALAEPLDRLERRVQQLRRSAPVLGAQTPDRLLQLSLLSPSLTEPVRRELTTLLRHLAQAGAGQPPADGVLGASPPAQRFVSPSGRFLFAFLAMPKPQEGEASHDDAATAQLRRRAVAALRSGIVATRAALLQQDPAFAQLRAGVTGVPVIETDEADQSVRDASRATGLAFLLILSLLFWVYRGAWTPLLAIASLLVGVAWTFGYLTLAVGRLQLLSVTFAVILLGLGVDTAIHLIARLELVRPDHDHLPAAVRRTFLAVGPGVLTSAATTAVALAALALTPFAGLAEMGLIAAGGVALCAVSVMTCFPAALELLPRPERALRSRRGGEGRPFMRGKLNVVDRKAPLFASIALALTLLAAVLGLGVRYDTDLLKLLPDNVESARWERLLAEDDEQSVWHALAPAPDLDAARRLTASLRSQPHVAAVGAAGALFPQDLQAKQRLLATLPDPGPLDAYTAAAPFDPQELRRAAEALRSRAPEDLAFTAACDAVAALGDDEAVRAAAAYRADRAALARTIAALRTASPPRPEELPKALRDRWIGRDGSLLLQVLPPKPDECGDSVLARPCLDPFATETLAASTWKGQPLATGPAVQIHLSTRVIEQAYLQGALLALVVVLLMLLLDFHHPLDALCALAPVLMAAALTAAVMALAGVSLNFANMVTLPLLAGIGVSAGVHAVHRWRQQPHHLPAGLAGGCGRSITLTIVTTMLGFASMMTAQHRGVRSLGFVMTVGLAMVWLATVFALPALLRLRTPEPPAEPPSPPSAPQPVEQAAPAPAGVLA